MKKKWTCFLVILVGISAFIFFADMNSIALKVLSKVKTLCGQQVDLMDIEANQNQPISHSLWNSLLQKHVSLKGNVDYNGFIDDQEKLQTYLDSLSQYPPSSSWAEEEELAYWINAYNAFTIKLILDNWPVASIKELGGNLPMINSPWDIKFFKIGGVDFDLNTIEHEILRKKFDEPRIHFAIVCASRSCPSLMNSAFKSEVLESQLERQSRHFINDLSKNEISTERTALSQIFSWFKSDFDSRGGVKNFIQQYIDLDLSSSSIRYIDYDWALND